MTEEPVLSYAFGDVHGCLDKLVEAIAACRRHAAGRPARFVMLGDYIDRGPRSREVLELLMGWKGPEGLVCLKGNHEEMLLLALENPHAAETTWRAVGGQNTLWSYGAMHPHQLPSAVTGWIAGLPTSYDDGLRFFCHAGIDPKRPLGDQRDDVLLWTRADYPDDFDPGRFVVHGHIVEGSVPRLSRHRLNLDTGAYAGGPLSAAAFEPDRREPAALIVGGRIAELPPLGLLRPKIIRP